MVFSIRRMLEGICFGYSDCGIAFIDFVKEHFIISIVGVYVLSNVWLWVQDELVLV